MGEIGGGPWFVLGMISLEIFAWITIMVLPYGWQRKMTLLFKFDAGLYEAIVHPGPASMLAINLVKSVKRAFVKEGEADVFSDDWFGGEAGKKYSIAHLEGLFCQHGIQTLVGNFCDGFRKLHLGSLILIFMAGFGVLCLLLGGYFYYHYWFVRASKKCYDWILRFFVIAPILFEVGVSIYCFLATDVNRMDPPNVPGFNYSFFAASILSVLAWLPFMVQQCFIGLHPLHAAKELKADSLEDDMGMPPPSYGSTQGYGGAAETADWGQQYPGYSYGQTNYQAPALGFGAGYAQPAPQAAAAPPPPSFQQAPSGYPGGAALPTPPATEQFDTGILPVNEGGTMPELRARTLGPGQL